MYECLHHKFTDMVGQIVSFRSSNILVFIGPEQIEITGLTIMS